MTGTTKRILIIGASLLLLRYSSCLCFGSGLSAQ